MKTTKLEAAILRLLHDNPATPSQVELALYRTDMDRFQKDEAMVTVSGLSYRREAAWPSADRDLAALMDLMAEDGLLHRCRPGMYSSRRAALEEHGRLLDADDRYALDSNQYVTWRYAAALEEVIREPAMQSVEQGGTIPFELAFYREKHEVGPVPGPDLVLLHYRGEPGGEAVPMVARASWTESYGVWRYELVPQDQSVVQKIIEKENR